METHMVGNMETDAQQLSEAHRLLDKLAEIALRPGFYGTFAVELHVRNGEVKYIRRITTVTSK